jgi:hypothetical protein
MAHILAARAKTLHIGRSLYARQLLLGSVETRRFRVTRPIADTLL